MQISVRLLNGGALDIDIEPTDNCLRLKENIAEVTGLPVEDQLIISAGKKVPDHMRLGLDSNFRTECEVHLVIKPKNNNDVKNLIDNFENDRVKLLWTVYYLGKNDKAILTKTSSITGSTDFETAYQSYLTRCNHEASEQKTYLALTAIDENTLNNLSNGGQSHKFFPATTYVTTGDDFPVLTLAAVFNVDGELRLVQNPEGKLHYSNKYQDKLREYLNNDLRKKAQIVDEKAQIVDEKAPNVDANAFVMAVDNIDAEIDFEDDEQLICDELQRFIEALQDVVKLPVPVKPSDVALHNLLLTHLNEGRRVVDKTISDEAYINHIKAHVQEVRARKLSELKGAEDLDNEKALQSDFSSKQVITNSAVQLPNQGLFACKPIEYDSLSVMEQLYINRLADDSSKEVGVEISGPVLWGQFSGEERVMVLKNCQMENELNEYRQEEDKERENCSIQ